MRAIRQKRCYMHPVTQPGREFRIAFGPVPSKRLGASLGVNNLPAKNCSYSCVYCQAGLTLHTEVERRSFFAPEDIAREVTKRVTELRARNERINFLSFVPDGEPTLDKHLGREIELLRPLGIPIAVITNASLLWLEDVREDLAKADWVSLKIDTVSEEKWRWIHRPHPSLRLNEILEGIRAFATAFPGNLNTETMLLKDINDGREEVTETARFISRLKPRKAYLHLPTRPPADSDIRGTSEKNMVRAYQIFVGENLNAYCLTGSEGLDFGTTGDLERDLLGIVSVHPMKEEAVRRLVAKSGGAWSTVERLMSEGRIRAVDYEGDRFYLQAFATPPAGS